VPHPADDYYHLQCDDSVVLMSVFLFFTGVEMRVLENREKEEILKKLLVQREGDVYCTGVLGKFTDCWHINKIKVYKLEPGEYWGREMGISYIYLVYVDEEWKIAELYKYERFYRGGYGERCSEGDYDIKVLLDNETVAEGVWSYYSCVPPLSGRWAYLSLKLVKPVILAIADLFEMYLLVP